jgi:hypothetical protein
MLPETAQRVNRRPQKTRDRYTFAPTSRDREGCRALLSRERAMLKRLLTFHVESIGRKCASEGRQLGSKIASGDLGPNPRNSGLLSKIAKIANCVPPRNDNYTFVRIADP